MFAPAQALPVTESQKVQLEALVRNGSTPQKTALRSRLILLAQEGVANHSISQQLRLSRPTVLALRAAFAKDGMAAVTGIRHRKRKGSVLTPELEKKILDTTLKTRPGDGSTQWSVRTLAKQVGVSRTIVHRVWQRHDVQPHRVERFKLSNDPLFEEKVRDIVGLYLDPPDRKEPDPSVGPHRADSSATPRPAGTANSRLQAPRHNDIVRGLQYFEWQGHRHLPRTPPQP